MDKNEQNKNGSIYKIVNDINDMEYIGSTFSELRKRFYNHKCKSKTINTKLYNAMSEIGVKHFTIILVENVSVKSRDELRQIEHKFIKEFDTMKNGYNGHSAYIDEDREAEIKQYRSEYRITNKDKINQYTKKYMEDNKEAISTQQRSYYEKNKEHITKRNIAYKIANKDKFKAKYECECGSLIQLQSRAHHNKSKKHQKFINNC